MGGNTKETPKAAPTKAPSEAPKIAPSAAPKLAEIKASTERGAEKTAASLGEMLHIPPEAFERNAPTSSILDAWEALAQRWEKLTTRLQDMFAALFAPAGYKRRELETQMDSFAWKAPEKAPEYEISHEVREDEEPESGSWKKLPPLTVRNWRRAENTAMVLREHPEYGKALAEASEKYKIPASTLAAFIEMESTWNPQSVEESGAAGLAQAMPSGRKTYRRYRESIGKPLPPLKVPDSKAHPDPAFFNPEIAIDFAGWHFANLIGYVNSAIERDAKKGHRDGFLEKYRMTPQSPLEDLYLVYNSGPLGYLLYKRFIDSNRSPEAFAQLRNFQKEKKKYDGKEMYAYESRALYAKRVAEVHANYEAMQTGAEELVRFEHPPLKDAYRSTSTYGVRKSPHKKDRLDFHNGADFAVASGTPAYAVKNGKVVEANPRGSGDSGNYVVIEDEKGFRFGYAHLSAVNIEKGAAVKAGDVIGRVGSTGKSTGPHLHFTVKDPSGRYRNPAIAVEHSVERVPSRAVA